VDGFGAGTAVGNTIRTIKDVSGLTDRCGVKFPTFSDKPSIVGSKFDALPSHPCGNVRIYRLLFDSLLC
jgi:hypothetical protein